MRNRYSVAYMLNAIKAAICHFYSFLKIFQGKSQLHLKNTDQLSPVKLTSPCTLCTRKTCRTPFRAGAQVISGLEKMYKVALKMQKRHISVA